MNQLAKEIYREKFNQLRDLMNRHWQISQVRPNSIDLPVLAAEIRRIAAVAEVWKAIAAYNSTSKYYQQDH